MTRAKLERQLSELEAIAPRVPMGPIDLRHAAWFGAMFASIIPAGEADELMLTELQQFGDLTEERRQWVREWCASPERAYFRGADMWLLLTTCLGIDLGGLDWRELASLTLFMRELDEMEATQPGITDGLPPEAFWAVLGWPRWRCRAPWS